VQVLTLILLLVLCHTKLKQKKEKGRGSTLRTNIQLSCLATYQKIPAFSLQKVRYRMMY